MANDMDTFFSSAEKQQQKEFEEKYNFIYSSFNIATMIFYDTTC